MLVADFLMSIKAKLEALIYAAEEPITLDQMAALLKDDLLALKTALPPSEAQPEAEAYSAANPEEENAETSAEISADASATTSEAATGELAHDGTKDAEGHDTQAAQTETVAVPKRSKAASKTTNKEKSGKVELRGLLKPILDELMTDFETETRGIEIRQVAGGYRMSTKPEHHDVVRAFAKSLKPPIRLSLQALETLAVIAYKQPVTVPEISDIRGVDASGVIGTLLERKLITTAGRKAVVGRPMLYKTGKDFLMRFGLKDLTELPSLEEFEKLAMGEMQDELFGRDAAIADATGVPDEEAGGNADEADNTAAEQAAADAAEIAGGFPEQNLASHHATTEQHSHPEHAREDARQNEHDDEHDDEHVADKITSESSGD